MVTVGRILLLCIVCLSSVRGQTSREGRYRYPLDIPARLNANFGELRPNHFHMGLDLFTERRTGLPVLAADDGYVGRVKVEPGGFGRALYLYHPDGTTTLYAHLERFEPTLEEAVRRRQYDLESWQMEWELPAGAFPVRRGQYVANSGNTGASAGPHVHFEVRRTRDDLCLNPLAYGLPLPDAVPPDIHRLAVYDRSRSVYEQSPSLHSFRRTPEGYEVPGVILVRTDRVSFAIGATDRMSGSPNPNGIHAATLWEGGRPLAGFRLDRIGYDSTRYLNAHVDIMRRANGGHWLQFLLPLPGDALAGIRTQNPRLKEIRLTDTLPHRFRITVQDVSGNTSQAFLTVRRTGMPVSRPATEGMVMAPGQVGVFETNAVQAVLDESALYDTIHFRHAERPGTGNMSFSAVHTLHRTDVPVHNYFTVRLRPLRPMPAALADRMVIRRTGSGSPKVAKAKAQSGWYAARFREFGDFELLADATPPLIMIAGLHEGGRLTGSTVTVRVTDDLGSVRNFRGEIDGRWVLFAQQGGAFTYRVDERCPPGRHTLSVAAEDEAGNKSVRSVVFTR
jgi:murein DD-endopeptidase MepM/ murein hydrolase activator NlpD